MVSLHAKPIDRPSAEEEKFWAVEAEHFRFQEPNPRAPQDTSDYRGWGIRDDKMPPADAVSYVLCKFREDELNLPHHDHKRSDYTPLHPLFKWSFLSVCMAHFLWFRTTAGAKWIMRFYGVQEVDPFREAYAYFWADQNTGSTVLLEPPVYNTHERTLRSKLVDGVELRIFRDWEKVLDPPCSATNRAPIEEMRKLLNQHRNPYATTEAYYPSEELFFWVSEVLRDWFLETAPNRDWPTRKPTRICGWQWVKQLERAPGVKFYDPIEKVALHRGRAYRLKDARGGLYWCGGKEIKIVPLKDLYLSQGVMTEGQINEQFVCKNCRKRKACVPATGESHRCCHCYAVEIDRSDRPTLERCTMDRECKACPDVITSHGELVTLKNRLNRPARTGPVPR
jgi:hypothetical protein